MAVARVSQRTCCPPEAGGGIVELRVGGCDELDAVEARREPPGDQHLPVAEQALAVEVARDQKRAGPGPLLGRGIVELRRANRRAGATSPRRQHPSVRGAGSRCGRDERRSETPYRSRCGRRREEPLPLAAPGRQRHPRPVAPSPSFPRASSMAVPVAPPPAGPARHKRRAPPPQVDSPAHQGPGTIPRSPGAGDAPRAPVPHRHRSGP